LVGWRKAKTDGTPPGLIQPVRDPKDELRPAAGSERPQRLPVGGVQATGVDIPGGLAAVDGHARTCGAAGCQTVDEVVVAGAAEAKLRRVEAIGGGDQVGVGEVDVVKATVAGRVHVPTGVGRESRGDGPPVLEVKMDGARGGVIPPMVSAVALRCCSCQC